MSQIETNLTPIAPVVEVHPRRVCNYANCGMDASVLVQILYPQRDDRPPFTWGAYRCLFHLRSEEQHAKTLGATLDVKPIVEVVK